MRATESISIKSNKRIKLNESSLLESALRNSFTDPSLHQLISRIFAESDIETRTSFLQCFLGHANGSDLAFIHGYVSNSAHMKINFLTELPNELSVIILTFLLEQNPESIFNVARVCKTWKNLLEDNDLWRRACRRRGWVPLNWYRYITITRGSQELVRRHSQPPWFRSVIWSVPSFKKIKSPWKNVFLDNYLTDRNWKSGKCQVTPVKKPVSNVMNHSFCLSFDETLEHAVSITNAAEGEGLLWNISNGQMISRLVGHDGAISAIKIGQNITVTGGVDSTLRIWETDGGKCLNVLRGHEGEINCLQFDDEIVVTGSQDHTLRVWSIEDGSCVRVLEGHSDAVTCLQFDERRIVSGSCDGSLRVWNRGTFECVQSLLGHADHIYCVNLDENQVLSGSGDKSIRIFDVRTGKCLRTLTGHTSAIVSLQSDKSKIISGSSDKTIKVWNYASGFLMYTLQYHSAPVWHLRFDQSRLLSSSFDQKVLEYNFSGSKSLSEEERNVFGIDEEIDG